MDSADKLLKSTIKWAKVEENIRTLILLGSRAHKGKPDLLADIDIYLFTKNPETYLNKDDWIKKFGNIWGLVKKSDSKNASRHVIFEGGILAEFTFFPIRALSSMQETLPAELEPGYQVLVDKDHAAQGLPKASGLSQLPEKPSVQVFKNLIQEFWFNAYHVAKYLWRGELWRAKHYDWETKSKLLSIMSWHALLCRNQENFTVHEGSHLSTWCDPEDYTALMTVFGRFYPADAWRALEDTQKLFTRLAKETAIALNTSYPQDEEEGLQDFILFLKENPRDS